MEGRRSEHERQYQGQLQPAQPTWQKITSETCLRMPGLCWELGAEGGAEGLAQHWVLLALLSISPCLATVWRA
jgi:hypothetical protein